MPAGRLPTFLIIGLPKAGTTSLASYLAAHPDVFMSAEKELNFFNRGEHDEAWYRAQFSEARDARAVGEATPTYIVNETALDRIASTLPRARLLVMMRNPVDRAYSHYWWNRQLAERRDFAAAVRSEMAAGRSDVPLTPAAGPGRYHTYTGQGRYLELLRRVCDRFPREALLPLVMEDLRGDPARLYAEACGFIGVDGRVSPAHLGAVMNPAYRMRSERLRHAMLRTRAWKRLPFGLADRLERLNRAPLDYPRMDDALRAELLDWFAPANEALAAWLGRSLPAWDR